VGRKMRGGIGEREEKVIGRQEEGRREREREGGCSGISSLNNTI
jgi:hypothetical protein